MIDARTHHDPANAPGLIRSATEKLGSQKELAARLGLTPRSLQMISKEKLKMRYVIQVAIEAIISDY